MIHVLLVDDNQNNRLTLELLLEEIEGITIDEAEDGQIALDMCKKKAYDLIFMDIMMPVMDGIEATQKIKELPQEPMIIALSALDDKESKHLMLKAGAQDYLTKPIESELFLQRIKNYLHIITLRKHKPSNEDALNPFSKEVYDRRLTFFIHKEESLVQFWDYFLQRNIFTCIELSDYVRIIYGFSLWLIKNKKSFTIKVEESENRLYIMLCGVGNIPKTVIKNIIQRHLENSIFLLSDDILAFELIKDLSASTDGISEAKESIQTNSETKEILSKTHDENLTASEYVETTAISIIPKIDSLENIENDLDECIINFENHPSKESINEVAQKFMEYHEVLSLLVQFEHLSFAVKSLVEFLQGLEDESFKDKELKNFVSLLLNLIHDLSSWRDSIFIKQDAINVHYLDASLLSSCLQIEAIFEEKTVDEGDDLEFF